MDNIKTLNQTMEALQKQLHLMKKARTNEHGFLHSGEQSMIRVIGKYSMERGKSPTSVILSQLLGITQATVTPLIDRLVKKGLVVKEISPLDKRAKLVSLTDEGLALLTLHRQREMAHLQALVAYLGEEDTAELTRMLEKITTFLDENNQN